MEYLHKNLPVYSYTTKGWTRTYQWNEVEFDGYNGFFYSLEDCQEVKETDNIPAKWWAVAVYTSYQVYGGPEEGGWWYSCGELTEHSKVRVFENFEEAEKYYYELWEWVYQHNKSDSDNRLTVRAFTEELPDMYWPKKTPYYH